MTHVGTHVALICWPSQVKGRRYFQCDPGHGIFRRRDRCVRDKRDEREREREREREEKEREEKERERERERGGGEREREREEREREMNYSYTLSPLTSSLSSFVCYV